MTCQRVRIAHLSDPHFGTVQPEIQRALLKTIYELKPSLIIISGDISQRARAHQFKLAREFTQSLKDFPLIAIPGNHDIPLFNVFARMFYPYAGFRSVFKGDLYRQKKLNGVHVIALNSTSRLRHIQGDLNLEKLRRKLNCFSDDSLIRIVTFHHPMACPKYIDVKNLIKGRNEVMKILAKYKVDLVLGGHIHDPHITLSTEHYHDVERASIFSVAGTCLSWRTRANAPNSFHLLEIDVDDCPRLEIIRYDIHKDELIFKPISSQRFAKDGEKGWQNLIEPSL